MNFQFEECSRPAFIKSIIKCYRQNEGARRVWEIFVGKLSDGVTQFSRIRETLTGLRYGEGIGEIGKIVLIEFQFECQAFDRHVLPF